MNLELVFLGTGASVPTVLRNLPSHALRREGLTALIDCGEGTQRQVLTTAVALPSLSAIFLTHLHGDHTLGLPGALLSMDLAGREAPLVIHGPTGTERFLKKLLKLFPLSFPVTVQDLADPDRTVRAIGCEVRCLRVRHRCEALAYRFDEPERPGRFDVERAVALGVTPGPAFSALQRGETVPVEGGEVRPDQVLGPSRPGRSVVFSGDTSRMDELAEFAEGADVLVHEATYEKGLGELAEKWGHSTTEDAARTAKEAGVRKLFLVHTSPRYHTRPLTRELLAQARAVFEETEIPADLETYEVPLRE